MPTRQRGPSWRRRTPRCIDTAPADRRYLAGNFELVTHQVVKGSEFTHVMVVLDDHQSGGSQISYDKLFGATELGERDLDTVQAGKETAIDRTLRLLYVTCSRARESLALVLWAESPTEALKSARHGRYRSQRSLGRRTRVNPSSLDHSS